MTFFGDDDRIDVPEADRLVETFIRTRQSLDRVTTVDVLRAFDVENNHHNRIRVHRVLDAVGESVDEDWAGRTCFDISDVEVDDA